MPTPGRAVMLCGQARAPLAAIARHLARAGVALVIQAASADLEATRRLCRAVGQGGGRAQVIGAELGGEARSRRLVAAAWKVVPAIGACVICPAIPGAGGSAAHGLDDWQHGVDAGLRAPFFLAKHVGQRLHRAGGGRIVFAIGGAPHAAGPVAGVVRAALLCMVDGLAGALPDGVAVGAVVAGRRASSRSAAMEIAPAVDEFLSEQPRASGTVLTLGARPPRG